MEKHNLPELPADNDLPRPIVLNPEDLAAVAAAGMSLALSSSISSKVLIAGGIPGLQVAALGAAF